MAAKSSDEKPSLKKAAVKKPAKKRASRKRPTKPKHQGQGRKITEAQWATYLDHVARFRTFGLAADAAGISLESVRWRRKTDKEFAEAEEHAEQRYLDMLRTEATSRATEGYTERFIFNKEGQVIGEVTKKSDRLLEVMMKRFDKGMVERTEGTNTNTNVNANVGDPASALDMSRLDKEQKREFLKMLKLVRVAEED